jgi:hypothetical protein
MKMLVPPKERTYNHKYKNHTNPPVNADRVLTMEAARQAYYPDNEGIPIIRFWFGGKDYAEWYFDKGEENSRDKSLKALLKGENE